MKVLVIGLGLSGRAAARLLKSQGHEVVSVDKSLEKLEGLDFPAFLESEPLDISAFDFVVPSPGIPRDHPFYLKAKKIVGEAELSLPLLKDHTCLGITGTNGKTTVTKLVEHICLSSGKRAKAIGNVGLALAEYALKPEEEILVIELSSYQLETLKTPVLDAALILNITPDHLDRYANLEEYAAAKFQMGYCLKEGAPLFIQRNIAEEFAPLLKPFDFTFFDRETLDCISEISYRHERENAMAAWQLCHHVGISEADFARGLQTFKKPAHRIEFVALIDGVSYFDDSKGTNIDAVIQAVEAMTGEVILIAGGVDKGSSYAPWKSHFLGKVKKIIAIGQAAEKIRQELSDQLHVEIVESLAVAIERASIYGKKGDCVLLSPGCSSYDMFRDYAHRGEEFQRCINHLKKRGENP